MVTLVNNVLHYWQFASSREPGIFAITAQILSPIPISFREVCSFDEREWFTRPVIDIAGQ